MVEAGNRLGVFIRGKTEKNTHLARMTHHGSALTSLNAMKSAVRWRHFCKSCTNCTNCELADNFSVCRVSQAVGVSHRFKEGATCMRAAQSLI